MKKINRAKKHTKKPSVKTATLIHDNLAGAVGYAACYRLSHPMKGSDGERVKYVLVSAISCALDTMKPETYIFHSDETGKVLNWAELDGSKQGTTSHSEVLSAAGYTIKKGKK